jgi:CRP-like cAMP-binding protein
VTPSARYQQAGIIMQANHPINIEALLTHVPLFNGLTPEEIARIARSTREIHASKGDILFHKGDPCNGFHLLVYGQIKLAFTSPQGNEKVVEILTQGQSFGEALMFMEKPYIVFSQALTDSLLLHVSKVAVFDELERDHRLGRKMLAGMAMRLHQLMNDVESYSLHSGKQRIIGYLLRELPEADQNGVKVAVTLPTNKGVIASRLNLTQEHFSRILHELTELGLIVVEGRKIHIPSVANLRKHEG